MLNALLTNGGWERVASRRVASFGDNHIMRYAISLLALTPICATAAEAATITQAGTIQSSALVTQPLSYFDSSLGTLTSVSVQYGFSSGGTYTLNNPSAFTISGVYIILATPGLMLTGGNQDPLLNAAFNRLGSQTSSFSQPVAYNIAPRQSQTTFVNSTPFSTVANDTNATDLAAFSRAGGGLFGLQGLISYGVAGVNPADYSFNVSGAGTFGLVYTYSPAAATPGVPEPATWAMMMLGFGLIGGAVRRRRAAVAFA